MMRSTTWYRYFMAVLLLAVYIATFIQEGHLHFHHHAEHEHALHDDHCEQDACHASIYHPGASSCGHKAHYIPSDDPCYDCHEFIQVQHVEEHLEKEIALDDHTLQEFIGMDLCDLLDIRYTNVRGPPTQLHIS